ncbi:uncharacterized protein TNCV_1620291 [Trichonephila clavipes]|nr:uncharacterized protein TNCV_1620291 [Trichonephila clavipes]
MHINTVEAQCPLNDLHDGVSYLYVEISKARLAAPDMSFLYVMPYRGIVYGVAGATRGLLATDLVIMNNGQVTRMAPELPPPLLTSTPHQREDVLALDRFNVHRSFTWRVFSGTRVELRTRQHESITLTTRLPQSQFCTMVK